MSVVPLAWGGMVGVCFPLERSKVSDLITVSDCGQLNDALLGFSVCFSIVPQFILKNYGENPDNYNEQLKKLETLRQVVHNTTTHSHNQGLTTPQ